jgi:hypothetical protein
MSEPKPAPVTELTSQQLAGQLKVTPQTLLNWRHREQGPPYYRIVNRIVYYQHEVDEWRAQTRWAKRPSCDPRPE